MLNYNSGFNESRAAVPYLPYPPPLGHCRSVTLLNALNRFGTEHHIGRIFTIPGGFSRIRRESLDGALSTMTDTSPNSNWFVGV